MKGKMTLKEFFEKGHKFVDDDSFIDEYSNLFIVGRDIQASTANTQFKEDADLYVNSAEALEKPGTKVSLMQAAKNACESQIELTELIDLEGDFDSFVRGSYDDFDRRWDEGFIKVIRATLNAYDGK